MTPPRRPSGVVDTAAAVVQALAFLASPAGFIGAAIAVPMWMHRCYRNLPALGVTALSWSPAWAIGAWFMPVTPAGAPAGPPPPQYSPDRRWY